jgi:hypothetical protein
MTEPTGEERSSVKIERGVRQGCFLPLILYQGSSGRARRP